MKKLKFPKTPVIYCGVGCAIGGITPTLIQTGLPGSILPPGILPPPWSNNEIFLPLITAGCAIGLSLFLKSNLQGLLFGYGLGAITSATVKAVLTPIATGARLRARPVARRPPMRLNRARLQTPRPQAQVNANVSKTYVDYTKVHF